MVYKKYGKQAARLEVNEMLNEVENQLPSEGNVPWPQYILGVPYKVCMNKRRGSSEDTAQFAAVIGNSAARWGHA